MSAHHRVVGQPSQGGLPALQACHDPSEALSNKSSPLNEACAFSQWWEMQIHGLMDPHLYKLTCQATLGSTCPLYIKPRGPTKKGEAPLGSEGVDRPPWWAHFLHWPCIAPMHASLHVLWSPPSNQYGLIQWCSCLNMRIHGPTWSTIDRGVHPLFIQ